MPRKILKQDGNISYVFDNLKFRELYDSLRQVNKRLKVKDEISKTVCVEIDTVKKWIYGKNGPSDLETVERIAEYFKVDVMELLQKEGNESLETEVKKYENEDVIKDLYGKFVDFIELWSNTSRFFMVAMYYYYYVVDNAEDLRNSDVQEQVKQYHSAASGSMDAFSELRKAIHKARVFLPTDVISNLMTLACDIYDTSEQSEIIDNNQYVIVNNNDVLISNTDKQSAKSMADFYERLDDILKDYLP